MGSGWVASAGCHIFLAPPKAARVCLPNTRFMIHQPAGGAGGWATDIAIQAKEILQHPRAHRRVIATQTGKSLRQQCSTDMERDFWMKRRGSRQVRHRLAHHRAAEETWPDDAAALHCVLPVGQQFQGGVRAARDGPVLRERVRRLHETGRRATPPGARRPMRWAKRRCSTTGRCA